VDFWNSKKHMGGDGIYANTPKKLRSHILCMPNQEKVENIIQLFKCVSTTLKRVMFFKILYP
jgi:hypothetical protein